MTVFSDSIYMQPNALQPKVYEVQPGGVLNVEAESDGTFMSVELNGHPFMENINQKSQRMLIVPAGTIRVKSYFGGLVYAEKWLDLKAGETKSLRVTQRSIEEIPLTQIPPAKPAH